MHGRNQGPSDIKIIHDLGLPKIDIPMPSKIWHATKKYSINNTIPAVMAITWFHFSLAYVAATIITDNNLRFIKDIFNPTLMPVYAFVSIVLGVAFTAFLILKYIHEKRIEKGQSINEKIRGGKPGEISKIAKNALKIEIIPDLSNTTGSKKEKFSIILPISESQNEVLEYQREENRNKIICLVIIPCTLSLAFIFIALIQNKFSFANVSNWVEWTFIVFTIAVAVIGICVAVNKLKNNEINDEYNAVGKFSNQGILIPWRKGDVVSVMERREIDYEKNDPLSRLERLLDARLTDLIDKFIISLDEKLLKPASADIKDTLGNLKGIREDLKLPQDKVSQFLDVLNQLMERVNSLDIEGCSSHVQDSIKDFRECINNITATVNKVKDYQIPLIGRFLSSKQPDQGEHEINEFLGMLRSCKEDLEKSEKRLKESEEKLKKVTNQLQKLENKQNQLSKADSSSKNENATNELANTVREQRKEAERLKLQKKSNELAQQLERLAKEIAELPKRKEWKEKVNGTASEFLHYVLKSIKLEAEGEYGKIGTTLRSFCNNKIIIHWKDGSQTTCYMSKDGDLQIQPNTTVDFIDKNIQTAFTAACAA